MTVYLGIGVFILAILALIYVYLISPRLSLPADMELLSCDYAHRGLWNQRIPENSLSAFEYAARMGVGIELDIQPTRDGRIVVFHDSDLLRMCGDRRRVRELTLKELRELRLKDTNERIPTLSEVLRVVRGRVPLLIEIKGDRVGILEMRRHLSCYFKGLPDFKETRLKLVTINDPQELFSTLDYIADRWGEDAAPMAGNVYGV